MITEDNRRNKAPDEEKKICGEVLRILVPPGRTSRPFVSPGLSAAHRLETSGLSTFWQHKPQSGEECLELLD